MKSGEAPALKCIHCGALMLDEAVARSEDERESVRLAKAARAAAGPTEKK
jgi:hypothetical protein